MINRIVTVFKIIPILVFIVVLFVNFDAGVFADNWTAYGYGDLGDLNEQVRNTMLITTFVFIGIEGASVYSRYAKKREDVGKATVMGFLSVLSIFALVTLSSYSVVPQPELADTRQPSMVGVFQSRGGRLGRGLHQRRGHRLRARCLPRVDADGRRGHVHPRPRRRLPGVPRQGERRRHADHRAGGDLARRAGAARDSRLFVTDALNFLLDLATSLALLPYLLAAAYALKLGLTGESYEGVSAGARRKETIVAGAATAYTLFLFDAAGMKFVLLSTVILAPASLLYVKARSEHGAASSLRPRSGSSR